MSDLASVYAHPVLRQNLPSMYFVKGCIFAVAASPEIPMPETWMPWLVNGEGGKLTNQDVDFLADALMGELRDTLQTMRDEKPLLPANCQWSEQATQRQSLEQWLTGLLHGHQQLEPCWQSAWLAASGHPEVTEAPEKRLSRCLKLFSALADCELAINSRPAAQAQQLQQHLPQLCRQLPAMLKDYVTLAGELAGVLPNQFESVIRSTSEPGTNR